MDVEGKGAVEPEPVTVWVSRKDRAACMAFARELVRTRYGRRTDGYGKGLSERGPVYPLYVGQVCEQAFARWAFAQAGVKAAPNRELLAAGDRGVDFEVCGLRVAVCGGSSGIRDLYRPVWQFGVPPEELPDVWVRAHYADRRTRDERKSGTVAEATPCELRGWVTTGAYLLHGYDRPAYKGDHTNRVLDASRLEPMGRLAELVRNLKRVA